MRNKSIYLLLACVCGTVGSRSGQRMVKSPREPEHNNHGRDFRNISNDRRRRENHS